MTFLSLIPSVCPMCEGPAKYRKFCEGCTEDILFSMHNHKYRCDHCLLALPEEMDCPNCLDYFIDVNKVYALFDYIPPLQSLILRYKNAGESYLASYFGALFKRHIKFEDFDEDTVFVPIPSRNPSLRKRGYNPASLFAQSLKKHYLGKIETSILRCRHHDSKVLKTLDQAQRFASSSSQYFCAYRAKFKKVIIVDDVLTTGSTIHAASRALKAAGVESIQAAVIARAAIPGLF
ncbi:ComF family protein [Taylorella equigenitalis]|uniref:ComF family protein n=1 Tax=Taylorella equigenitalis TaxID=29575 RepID=UPI00041B44DE|nr:phosphoribosyltransferase family protein [Taylorella equigenitalis]WDU46474.1 ComF family protein [Taylorella equigenitalis]